MYGDAASAVGHWDWDADMRHSGILDLVCRLDGGQPAITVKTRNGNIVASEGPLFQSACLLHTCVVVEARDLNDAIRRTARMPGAELACIEIRPIVDQMAPCATESIVEGKSIEHENSGPEAADQTRQHGLDFESGTAEPDTTAS